MPRRTPPIPTPEQEAALIARAAHLDLVNRHPDAVAFARAWVALVIEETGHIYSAQRLGHLLTHLRIGRRPRTAALQLAKDEASALAAATRRDAIAPAPRSTRRAVAATVETTVPVGDAVCSPANDLAIGALAMQLEHSRQRLFQVEAAAEQSRGQAAEAERDLMQLKIEYAATKASLAARDASYSQLEHMLTRAIEEFAGAQRFAAMQVDAARHEAREQKARADQAIATADARARQDADRIAALTQALNARRGN